MALEIHTGAESEWSTKSSSNRSFPSSDATLPCLPVATLSYSWCRLRIALQACYAIPLGVGSQLPECFWLVGSLALRQHGFWVWDGWCCHMPSRRSQLNATRAGFSDQFEWHRDRKLSSLWVGCGQNLKIWGSPCRLCLCSHRCGSAAKLLYPRVGQSWRRSCQCNCL